MISGGGPDKDAAPLPGTKLLVIRGQPLPRTAVFCYVGGMLGVDRSMGILADVKRRVALAIAAFGLLKHIWRSKSVSLNTKSRMLMVCVASVLFFGAESWVLHEEERRLLHKTWMSFARRVAGVGFIAGGPWEKSNK